MSQFLKKAHRQLQGWNDYCRAAIFKDVHEPIVDRDTFEQVQKKIIKRTKRRAPKSENGEKSIFSDLLYCADCGHKLWYHKNRRTPNP